MEIDIKGRYYRYFPNAGYDFEDLVLSVKETALLLVDVDGLGFSEGEEPDRFLLELYGQEHFQKRKEITNNSIKPALEYARKVGIERIFTTNRASETAAHLSEFGRRHSRSMEGDISEVFDPERSTTTRFSKDICPIPNEHIIEKGYYSAFYETSLDSLLRNLGIRNLLCMGFATNICVHATLLDGLFRNYRIVLLRDCTMATEFPETRRDMSLTKSTIWQVEALIGYSTTSEELIHSMI